MADDKNIVPEEIEEVEVLDEESGTALPEAGASSGNFLCCSSSSSCCSSAG
jgi:hypothetical protein